MATEPMKPDLRGRSTLVLRVSKMVAVASIALLVSLVAFGNITDYGTNFGFVQHVLTMDTTFPNTTIRSRAITSPALHHAAYGLISALGRPSAF